MLLSVNFSYAAVEVIKYVSASLNRDQQKTYDVNLLELAIKKSLPKFGPATLKALGTFMVYQRKLKSLNDGELDVMWTMTSVQKDQEARAVMIPHFKRSERLPYQGDPRYEATNFSPYLKH